MDKLNLLHRIGSLAERDLIQTTADGQYYEVRREGNTFVLLPIDRSEVDRLSKNTKHVIR